LAETIEIYVCQDEFVNTAAKLAINLRTFLLLYLDQVLADPGMGLGHFLFGDVSSDHNCARFLIDFNQFQGGQTCPDLADSPAEAALYAVDAPLSPKTV
jgi:hypothetical protein